MPGHDPRGLPERDHRHPRPRPHHERQRHRPQQQQHPARRHHQHLHLAAPPRGLRGAGGHGGHGQHDDRQLRRRAGDGRRRLRHRADQVRHQRRSTAPAPGCTRTTACGRATGPTPATSPTPSATSAASPWAVPSSRTSCSSSGPGRATTRPRRARGRGPSRPRPCVPATSAPSAPRSTTRPPATPTAPAARPFPTTSSPPTGSARSRRRSRRGCPLPNAPGTSSNYTDTGPVDFTRNNYDVKLNYNVSSAAQVFAKYSQMNGNGVLRHVAGQPSRRRRGRLRLRRWARARETPRSGSAPSASPGRSRRSSIVDGTFGLTRFDQTCLPPDYGTNFGTDVFGIPGTNGDGGSNGDIRTSGMPGFGDQRLRALRGRRRLDPALPERPQLQLLHERHLHGVQARVPLRRRRRQDGAEPLAAGARVRAPGVLPLLRRPDDAGALGLARRVQRLRPVPARACRRT